MVFLVVSSIFLKSYFGWDFGLGLDIDSGRIYFFLTPLRNENIRMRTPQNRKLPPKNKNNSPPIKASVMRGRLNKVIGKPTMINIRHITHNATRLLPYITSSFFLNSKPYEGNWKCTSILDTLFLYINVPKKAKRAVNSTPHAASRRSSIR